MSRSRVDYRTASKNNYKRFCEKYPELELSYEDWLNIVYSYMEIFKTMLLETGKKEKLPNGFGEFGISKRKTKRFKQDPSGRNFINLPVDWKKTKEKGKIIYNLNFHTEGYRFYWKWFKSTAIIQYSGLWYFKANRATSRLLAHYLKVDEKYQYIYCEW